MLKIVLNGFATGVLIVLCFVLAAALVFGPVVWLLNTTVSVHPGVGTLIVILWWGGLLGIGVSLMNAYYPHHPSSMRT
mgnify:CR=1 FL=1